MAKIYDESEKLYKQGIRAQPLDGRNYHNLAALYLKMNEVEKAESLLKQVLKVHPDYLKAYELLGRIYQKKEDYPKALGFYQKSLPKNYNDMEFRNFLSRIKEIFVNVYGRGGIGIFVAPTRCNPWSVSGCNAYRTGSNS